MAILCRGEFEVRAWCTGGAGSFASDIDHFRVGSMSEARVSSLSSSTYDLMEIGEERDIGQFENKIDKAR